MSQPHQPPPYKTYRVEFSSPDSRPDVFVFAHYADQERDYVRFWRMKVMTGPGDRPVMMAYMHAMYYCPAAVIEVEEVNTLH